MRNYFDMKRYLHIPLFQLFPSLVSDICEMLQIFTMTKTGVLDVLM